MKKIEEILSMGKSTHQKVVEKNSTSMLKLVLNDLQA